MNKFTQKHRLAQKPNGFTIVELLIVIVVIAILAAISVVAYTGIQGRAYDSTVQNDLRQVGQKLEMYRAQHGNYPTPETANMASVGLSATKSAYHDYWFNDTNTYNFIYCHTGNGSGAIALIARSKSGTTYQFSGGSVSLYTGSLTASGTTLWCQAAGAPTAGTANGERTLIRSGGTTWASWMQ